MKRKLLFIVCLSAMLALTNSILAAPPGGSLVTDVNVQTKNSITTVEIEGTLQMIARIMPNNATIKTVMWSVNDPAIAKIDLTSGILSGISLGEVWVIANAIDGSGIKDSMKITVIEKSIPITGVKVFSENDLYEVAVGNNLRLSVLVEPDEATDTTVKWASGDLTLATVSQKGLVSAIKEGVVWIKATANDGSGIVDSVKITIVASIPVSEVIISGDSVVAVGTTTKLKVNVLPDNASDTSVTWSSSKISVATVSMSGMVSGVAEGYAWIRAISKDNTSIGDSVYMHVTKFIPVTAINITTNTGDTVVFISDTLQLTATIIPDSASKTNINWTISNAAIASISSTGLVIGKTEGTVTITASATDGSGVKGTITIKVIKKPITSIVVESISDTVAIGFTMQMTANILPVDATNKTLNWSVSNGAIASVDASGLVTGIAKGKVNIIATAADGSGISDSKEISVVEFVPVTAITVKAANAATSVGLGDTLNMSAVIVPDTASIQSVTWSVDNSIIATINASGELVGKSIGTVIITATANDGTGIKGTKSIDVVIIPVTSIIVENEADNDTLYTSMDMQMTAKILPLNATDKSVTWSVSTPAIATIDAYTGVLSGVAAGSVDVIATAKDGSGIIGQKTIKVVSYIAVTSITVSGTNNDSTVSVNNSLQMVAIVKPDNASIGSVTWKVSNSLIASIDENGLITGINTGKVTVSALAKDKSGIIGTKVIEVILKSIESITVTTKSGKLILVEGDSVEMIANIVPVDVSNKEVEWSVNNSEVATINANGMLVTKTAGTVTITATAKDGSGKTGTLNISVIKKAAIESSIESSLIAYPSPVIDFITIEGGIGNAIMIINIHGQVVKSLTQQSDKMMVDMSDLPVGFYFISSSHKGKLSMIKIVKQ